MAGSAVLLAAVLLAGCGNPPQAPDQPHDLLSQYGFFEGRLADLSPAARVLPYDLNSPLFTDYAYKARFVWMPEGTSAEYTESHVLDFPEGAVLIKNFYYPLDETDPSLGRRILETRLLINRSEEWEAVGYIWNEEQTDAVREVIGDIQQVSWVDSQGLSRTIDYIIPNRNQCKSCHLAGDRQIPIGPKVRNLNKPFAYPDGEMNQLAKWASVGYLTGFEPEAAHARASQWDDPAENLHDRALSYLDINCGHCHNPSGSANTSGLNLVSGAPMDIALGIYKAPVSAGGGTGGRSYSIVPGHPDESIMVYRMDSTDPAEMMPELGRGQIHEEGVALIREWIAQMPDVSPPVSPN
ncbi:MAG: hypothetical protein HKN29_03030 [Rhodothermales bacterium]|nr:hypothetical protein [Rhodothermales bacterium]